MEASQQFHLKWNNHSLNTLSSFQQLLDTNTLVDVTLTCSNGKTVTAHRMVLAACSEYFYRLFKDLPEKHPVIVFKDANEDIVKDLLLFMYKGEVEVQESNLNDFLKFADTLQVKGLSQSDRDDVAATRAVATATGSGGDTSIKLESPAKNNNNPVLSPSIRASFGPIPGPTAVPLPPVTNPSPYALPDMTKSYLAAAGLAKFPPIFPLPTEPNSAADLLTHLSSPNLYRALHTRKYQNPLNPKFPDGQAGQVDSQVLKGMPFLNLKKMFGGDHAMAAAAADMTALYQQQQQQQQPRDDNDNDSLPDRSSSPPTVQIPPAAHQASRPATGESGSGATDENGHGDKGSSPMESDYNTPPPPGDCNRSELNSSSSTPGPDHKTGGHDSDSSSTTPSSIRRGGSSKQAAGRGSRLERMIAAEYKIMSEYAEQNQELPVMTPELMKSRRTHSLQLAIGEILHNRASVQSAATKYHIPRETLRRHYQRYLKAMGIQKAPGTVGGGPAGGERPPCSSASSAATAAAVRASATTNNNAKLPQPMDTSSADESSNGFSSLMDIGQAYGIFNPEFDSTDFKSKMKDEALIRRAAATAMTAAAAAAAMAAAAGEEKGDEKEKDLVIDEDENVESPGLQETEEVDVEEEDDEGETPAVQADNLVVKRDSKSPEVAKGGATMETMS